MKSIRRTLLGWLFAGMTLVVTLTAATVYLRARDEAGRIFDYQLQLTAEAFPSVGYDLAAPAARAGEPNDNLMVVQVWNLAGVRLYLSAPDRTTPQGGTLGFSTVNTSDGDWRVYNAIVGDNIVQVAQPTRAREALAEGLALRTLIPLIVAVPILLLLVWIAVERGMRPLNAVALALRRRSAESLDPLQENGLPSEITPLVSELNDLLARLGRALQRQRAFIADAAHELRTPMAAIQLQAQVIERASTEAERLATLSQLRRGAARATRLVGQLLALARSEPDSPVLRGDVTDLREVAREVIAELATAAERKSVDLGMSEAADGVSQVRAARGELRVMIENLIDNAVRYTPEGGTVDVGVDAIDARVRLSVTDTGPGIPPEERERVFDRFYRRDQSTETGSGLGLAIVKQIVERCDGTVRLSDGANGRGLTAAVEFPAA